MIVVVGAGIAGLCAALAAAGDSRLGSEGLSAGGQSFAAKTAVSGCRERRAQSGDTRSDYDDHGCTSSMRCNAILASRAVSSSTVMRLTILPCSMFSNAHARYAG